MSPNFWGCRCCGGEYDVLGYSLDGNIVHRQYHGHGGYSLEKGYKPGIKVTVSADSGDVVCASDTNLSIMSDSRSGEAERFYAGTLSSYATGQQRFDYLADGGLLRFNWRVAKKANTNGGKWLVSCQSQFLRLYYPLSTNPQNHIELYKRMWLLDRISLSGISTNGVPLSLTDPDHTDWIQLTGDRDSDWAWDDPQVGGSVFCWNAGSYPYYYDFKYLVDGHIPQSVLGDDVVWNNDYTIGSDENRPARASVEGYIAESDVEDDISGGPLRYVEASHYYWGGATLHYDGSFAYTTQSQTNSDGPVATKNVYWSLHQTWTRHPGGFPVQGDKGAALYWDTVGGNVTRLFGAIVSMDENQHWHGFSINSWSDGQFLPKTGSVSYIELDFTDMRDWDDWFSGDTPETDLHNRAAASVRKLDNPFGTVSYNGSNVHCIPKDVYCLGGFLYTLLADEDDPRYWRRLVKIDLTDFSVVWTQTPPKEWQCFHDLAVSGDKIWVAVSASDGTVFVDPTEE